LTAKNINTKDLLVKSPSFKEILEVLTHHQFAGSYELKGIHYVVCGCVNTYTGYNDAHVRHQAEEIAKLVK
jgi:hypothetical protein